MFTKITYYSLVVLMILVITSCAYYPHLMDVPLINKKGDTRLEGGLTAVVPSAHITITHGLTDKIAVQAAGSIGGNGTYGVQGAAGIFKNLQTLKVVEIYGGFSYGYGEDYKDSNPGNLYGNYQVYFAQVNYGKITGRLNKNMNYGVGIKLGYLHTSMTDRNFYEYYSEIGPYHVYKDTGLLIEPVFFLRFGGEKLKFQLMAGGCWIFKFTHTDKKLPFCPINIGVGVSYSL